VHPFEGRTNQILVDFVARSTVVGKQLGSIGLGFNQLRGQEESQENCTKGAAAYKQT
jgi:hypothetical protein